MADLNANESVFKLLTNQSLVPFEQSEIRDAINAGEIGKITGVIETGIGLYITESDAGKMIVHTGVGDTVMILDPNETMPPVLSEVVVVQAGAGQVTIQGDNGVTIIGDPKTNGQDQAIYLVHQEENVWRVIGGVE